MESTKKRLITGDFFEIKYQVAFVLNLPDKRFATLWLISNVIMSQVKAAVEGHEY